MDEMIYNTLSYYFHALEVKGYMPFRDSVKALLLIFYRDFVFNDFRARITEEDYHLIEKALDCLYGTTCLIPYPDYLKMGNLYLDEITELGARVKNVEDEDTEWSDVQGGGSGNVNSVNGKTGDVILNANDVGALPANTEYQSPINDLESIRSGAQSGATAYQKPNTGIPSTDLSSAVQVSLRKADSALQTETDPTVPSWAKQSSKPSYTVSEIDGAQEELVSGTNIKTINNESILGSGNITIQGGGGGDVNVIESITFNGSAVPVDASKNAAITYSAPVTSVNGNTGAVTISVPTKVSDLTNDSGFITSYTETDPVFSASAAATITSADITAWNEKSTFSGSYNDLTDKPTLFSGDYNDLSNKPTIPTVPTNVSAFTNDAGYITGYTETDPTVPSWAKAASKPSYTASEVGALPDDTPLFSGDYNDLTNKPTIPAEQIQSDWNQTNINSKDFIKNKPTIPTALSQLSEDSTHRVVSDAEKTTWNNKSNFSGSYNDLTDKPTIPDVPTNVSAFTNDAGYLTQHQSLSDYIQKSQTAGLIKNDGTIDTNTYLTQHQDISGKENVTTIVAPVDTTDATLPITTLTCEVGKYYRIDVAVDTLAVTLPAMTDLTIAKTVVIYLTGGTTPSITISTADSKDVYFQDGFEIKANSTYEINCLFNGVAWIVAAAKINVG